MAINIVRNVPADRVDATERMFREAGATDIERLPEDDNEFTLIITSPDRETFHQLNKRVAI